MIKGRVGRTEWVEGKVLRPNQPLPHRKPRSDKKIRVNTPIDLDTHELLRQLAFKLRLSKTHMMAEIVEIMLRNPAFINWVQDEHRIPKEERIIPATVDGKVVYKNE